MEYASAEGMLLVVSFVLTDTSLNMIFFKKACPIYIKYHDDWIGQALTHSFVAKNYYEFSLKKFILSSNNLSSKISQSCE